MTTFAFSSKYDKCSLNMIEPNNGQVLSTTAGFPAAVHRRLMAAHTPQDYRQIVRLLSEGVSANQICKLCTLTPGNSPSSGASRSRGDKRTKKEHHRDSLQRAELGAGRMEKQLARPACAMQPIGTGVAVDKLLALTGQMPAVQIAN